MKKVLIPISYHPVSQNIAESGYALAKKLGAEVCLMHVIKEPNYYSTTYPNFIGYGGFGGETEILRNTQAQQMAKEFLRKVADHLESEIQTHVARGETASCILEYAEKWAADIIVMGTHSRGILKKVFLGSKASEVLERTSVPVYFIPVKK